MRPGHLSSGVRIFRIPQLAALATGLALFASVRAENVVAIGDSLTAEYDTIPNIPGFPTEATAYAEVTVPGWVSMSWVEIVARLRPDDFNFGSYRKLSDPWVPPRLSGYEFNWGIPGVEAGQYEDFVTSTALSNPGYFIARQPLENQLRNRADRVVIWLGGNEFRANYGALYDGGSSDTLIAGLLDDLGRILNFTRKKSPDAQIVILTVPDLGATPSKKAAHPDPEKRALVTAATEAANAQIVELAAKKGVVVANAYAQTERLVKDLPTYFGAVQLINDKEADNDPHYAFTRDGLHPNTPLQIRIARTIIGAFNAGYSAGIPQITDAEALAFLHINPNEPYYDWIDGYGVAKRGFLKDPDLDGLTNLVEYAFGLDPSIADAAQLPANLGGPMAGISGDVSVHYTPDAQRVRHIRVRAQYSTDLLSWKPVPIDHVIANADGSFTAVVPPTTGTIHVRLKVAVIPPGGSTATIVSVVGVQ
jgi:hypothetical protein